VWRRRERRVGNELRPAAWCIGAGCDDNTHGPVDANDSIDANGCARGETGLHLAAMVRTAR